MRKFFCITVLIAFLLTFCSCSITTQGKIKNFDKASSLIEQLDENEHYKLMSSNSSVEKCLEEIGLTVFSNYTYENKKMPQLDEEFVDAYLEKHTPEQLLNNYIVISKYVLFDSYGHNGGLETEECVCYRFTNLLKLILEKIDVDIINFDPTVNEIGEFYKVNSDAEPQPYTKEHSGKFYNYSGENRYTSTRTDTGTVEYYGDFALLKEEWYSYSSGDYGWSNGTFLNTLPSWERKETYSLYYKGILLKQEKSFDAIKNSNCQIFSLNDKLYSLYNKTQKMYPDRNPSHTFLYVSSIETN